MAGSGDILVRHANYGIELVDALTDGELVGPNTVLAERLSASPPFSPPSADSAFVTFRVNRSRWVFEDLEEDVLFRISADFYLAQTLEAGVQLPPVPPSSAPGVLATVVMKPRSGYPFPRTLTHAIGAVRLAETVDPSTPLVPGALVTVTPIHDFSPRVEGPVFETTTADDGQYAVWFSPEPTFEQPSAIAFDALATAMVDIGGVLTSVQGAIFNQPLVQQSFNGAETIFLEP